MAALFTSLSATLTAIALGLAGLGAAAGLLAWVCAWLMNLWGIIDPRMGQAVKGALLRIAISLAGLAAAAGGVALFNIAVSG